MFDKYKGKTFAQVSNIIDRKYPNRQTDKTQKRAFDIEMSKLMRLQEAKRSEVQNDNPNMMNDGGVVPMLPTIDFEVQYDTPVDLPAISRYSPTVDPIQSGTERGMIPSPRNVRITQPLPPRQSYSLTDPELPGIQMEEPFSSNNYDRKAFGDTKVGSFLNDNIYAPVAIGKGLEFAAKAFQLADGYDTVDPELNPNASRIQQIMSRRGINLDSVRNEALSGYNRAVEGANPIRSQAVRQAIIQDASGRLGDTMANVSLQEQQADNTYRAEEAQTLNVLGQQEVAARNYAEQLNNQSKLGYQQSLQNLFTSVGNAGQELTNFRAGVAQQQLMASALSTANFQMGDVKETLRKAAMNEEITVDDMIQIINQGNQGATKEQMNSYIEERKAYRASLKQ